MRLFPRTPTAILLITLSGACSLRDYSYLEEGDSSVGGKSNRAGAGGKSAAGGSPGGTSATLGGAAGQSGSISRGGSGGSGNSTSVSGAAGAAGTPVAPFNQMGPWDFDSDADAPASWQINLKGTALGWVAEGQSAPLGAMTMSCSGKPMGELSHRFGPLNDLVTVDLSTYTYTAYAKALNTAANVQLYASDSGYARAAGASVEVAASSWTKIEFLLAFPTSSTPAYNPAKLITLGIALPGCGDTVLIDRIELVNGVAGSSAGGAAGAAGRSSQAGQASTSAGTAGRSSTAGVAGRSMGGSSSAGTAGR